MANKKPAPGVPSMVTPRYIGAVVQRAEDPRLLMGRGRYVADQVLPGALSVAFLRSPHAHARIVSLNIEAARASDGVEAVIVGAELAAEVPPLRARTSLPSYRETDYPVMAIDKVRFVGDIVAAVVARDRYVAEDAVDLINVEYAPLPPVVEMRSALDDGGPLVHEKLGSNVILDHSFVAGNVEAAWRQADRVLQGRFSTQRHTGVPMETRGCKAAYDPGDGSLTVWSAQQLPHILKTCLAEVLRHPENRIRVVAGDVGGGFGIKGSVYPEEVVVPLLARRFGRPLGWIEDRREHLMSAIHAQHQLHDIAVAVSGDGRILGLRDDILVDTGAYSIWPWSAVMEPLMTGGFVPGPYDIEHYQARVRAVCTNKSPMGPYRGVARPASTFAMESTIDLIARSLEIDPAEVRRRNFIQPEAMPYRTVTRLVYDSGDFPSCLERALEVGRYHDLRSEQEQQRRAGRCVGIGIGAYVELTALGSGSPAMPGSNINPASDSATVTIDPSGKITAAFGVTSQGQSLETTLAQVLADAIGVTPGDIAVHLGDTARTPYGMGSFASRCAVIGGGAAIQAGRRLRQKVLAAAAHVLEAHVDDLDLVDGAIYSRDREEPLLSLSEVAHITYFANKRLPRDFEPGLTATAYYDPVFGTPSNACHLALVEVDPSTGAVQVLKYVIAEDCGPRINPLVVEGQLIGGMVQGLGGALYEHLIYDEHGQLLTTTFMDYLVPSSMDIPPIAISHLETPSPRNLGGFKGMGEGGAIGVAAAVCNAVNDALRPFGAAITELPVTPQKVFAAINRGRG